MQMFLCRDMDISAPYTTNIKKPKWSKKSRFYTKNYYFKFIFDKN